MKKKYLMPILGFVLAAGNVLASDAPLSDNHVLQNLDADTLYPYRLKVIIRELSAATQKLIDFQDSLSVEQAGDPMAAYEASTNPDVQRTRQLAEWIERILPLFPDDLSICLEQATRIFVDEFFNLAEQWSADRVARGAEHSIVFSVMSPLATRFLSTIFSSYALISSENEAHLNARRLQAAL